MGRWLPLVAGHGGPRACRGRHAPRCPLAAVAWALGNGANSRQTPTACPCSRRYLVLLFLVVAVVPVAPLEATGPGFALSSPNVIEESQIVIAASFAHGKNLAAPHLNGGKSVPATRKLAAQCPPHAATVPPSRLAAAGCPRPETPGGLP